MTIWPWVLCSHCCAFPGEPCRVAEYEGAGVAPTAKQPHAQRLRDAAERDRALRELNTVDMFEFQRRRAS